MFTTCWYYSCLCSSRLKVSRRFHPWPLSAAKSQATSEAQEPEEPQVGKIGKVSKIKIGAIWNRFGIHLKSSPLWQDASTLNFQLRFQTQGRGDTFACWAMAAIPDIMPLLTWCWWLHMNVVPNISIISKVHAPVAQSRPHWAQCEVSVLFPGTTWGHEPNWAVAQCATTVCGLEPRCRAVGPVVGRWHRRHLQTWL